ncbi:hypothetical protein AB0F20_10315 [Streptomyces goshikiensis]|uniref:hypothetical protein n=1 Tax=Streptomyces goshikiensis TaxID=1942 RepID=UPI0033D5746B
MGYTHSFAYAPQSETFRATWLRLRLDAAAVIDFAKAAGIQLAGPDGRGLPVVSEGMIAFNGQGEGACEFFRIELTPSRLSKSGPFVWNFTKTAAKPYDMAVTAVLLRAHTLMPDHFAINSNGEWSDWMEARAINEALFTDTPPPTGEPFTDTSTGPAAIRR